MSQLRALLPLPVAQPTNGVVSPVSTSPGSLRQTSSVSGLSPSTSGGETGSGSFQVASGVTF